MSHKVEQWLWWLGVPVACSVISLLPYIGWNVLGGVPTWWRVPAVTPGLFDTYVYLQWMGAAAEGLAYGGHLKWFGTILAGLWQVMGSWASIPELWIVSRWFTFTLTLWVGAWTLRQWSGLPIRHARLLSVGFFCAVVVTLGMRPGVYAWYLPFCLAGMTSALLAFRALNRRDVVRAMGWSLLALALCWLYPWFFMVAGLWLAVRWMIFFVGLRKWIVPMLLAIASVCIAFVGEPLARWFLDPAQLGLIGMYERNGMAFARVPFLANTVLAIGTWIVLFFVLARRDEDNASQRQLTLLGGLWMTVLLLWFHTPFTGVHTYSDHFIGPVTALAWISLAVLWAWARQPALRQERTRIFLPVPWLIAAGATLFSLYVLQQPLRLNIRVFDSYVIHLAHWFALAVAGWIAVWRIQRPTIPLTSHKIIAVVLIVSALIGVGGITPAFIRDIPRVAEVSSRVPVIAWIREQTRADASVCTDLSSASFYAAHTGRFVFPAEAVLSRPDASEAVIRKLETYASAYDAIGSGSRYLLDFYTDHYRTIPCEAESEYSHNAPYARALRSLGFGETRVNELIGCDLATIHRNRARVGRVAEAWHASSDASRFYASPATDPFRALCPFVIISESQKPYWRIPADYVEHPITSQVSVWQIP